MYQLAVCAETVFQELPFEERVKKIAEAGFLVEFWRHREHNVDALVNQDVRFSNLSGSDRGSMMHPDGVQTYLEDVERSIAVAKRLGCRQLMLLTGELGPAGESIHMVAEHPATRWITAYRCLSQAVELAEKHDVTFSLEPLNIVLDHVGYPLPYPEDAVRLIEQVASPRINLLLDVYHTQMQQGNVIQAIRDYADYLGYVHVADVPGRHEPATGEINYPAVAEALREVGYEGNVGLEAFPESDDALALSRFREAFSA